MKISNRELENPNGKRWRNCAGLFRTAKTAPKAIRRAKFNESGGLLVYAAIIILAVVSLGFSIVWG